MKKVVMSGLYPCFCGALADFGYDIIPTKNYNQFSKPERLHADMQLLRINDRLFTIENCEKSLGERYPENVRLNCLLLGDCLYGKLSAVDDSVIDYCIENGIEPVNVNQGYTRCSTLVVNENAVITSDKSIEKALKNNGADVLLITPGNIILEGFDYGFIGGASFTYGGTVYFFGNIKEHPDYEMIKAFCEKYNSNIEILCEEMPLTDIGGAVLIPS